MNTKQKATIGCLFFIPILWALLTNQNHFFAYLSNSYFYIAAFCLIIGLFAQVFKAGTFDLFHYSLHKYLPKQKNDYAAEKLHSSEGYRPLSQRVGNWHYPLLKIGGCFLMLSILFLFIHYSL